MEKDNGTKPQTPVTAGTTVGKEHFTGKQIPVGVIDGHSREGWFSALESPTRCKLMLLNSGNAILSIHGRETAIIAPAAVFIPHGSEVRLTTGPADGSDALILFHPQFVYEPLTLNFHFTDERDPGSCNDGYMLYRFAPDREPAERSLFLEPSAYRFLRESVERMGAELESQPDGFWPCRARSFLLEILIACTRLRESPVGIFVDQSEPADGTALRNLYGYLIAHLRERLTVDAIAREFGTNRTSLQERVRKATGLSVAQYIISLRVQTASVLLRNTSLPIAEVMERTGFIDESHFSRSFRRFAGKSPSDFRKAFIFPSYVK